MRCTVESQGPLTVMTAGVVGCLETDGERLGEWDMAVPFAHRCRGQVLGRLPRESRAADLTEDLGTSCYCG